MAKLQRWRRGASTPGPETAEPEVDTVEEHDVVEEDLDPDELDPDELDPDEDEEPELEESKDQEPEDQEPEDDDADEEAPAPAEPRRAGFVGWLTRGSSPATWLPFTLLQAAHAKQAVVAALAIGLAAIATGRPARECGVIVLTVLVGQTILGWHNDITDRRRDRRHGIPGKPLADGRLRSGTLWYAIAVAVLVLIPLSITTGLTAGCFYLVSVTVGMLGNVVLRTGVLSFWSWALSFALLPAYLSYGGWGGQAIGSPPETSIVVLAALLGVGVHFMRAVWGLVADHEDGWTYLPLKLGLKLGATRLLALSTLYTGVIVILLIVFGARDGLSR